MKSHTIKFRKSFYADLQRSRKQPLEQLQIKAGEVMVVSLRCYTHKLFEVADIEMSEGTLLKVHCSYFQFKEE